MATVYPSASGNWSDTSLWMEVGGNPYNQIPQVDDVVYLNGCTMTANMNINLGTNGEIRNDGDAGQGIAENGIINVVTSSRTFIANFYVYHPILLSNNSTGRITESFNGNIELHSSNFYAGGSININYVIVGDISAFGSIPSTIFTDRGSAGSTLSITGDVYVENSATLVTGNYSPCTITGDINGGVCVNSGSPSVVTISGSYMIVNKNEFQHSYPPENYVVSGTTYGDSSQFTGTMTQPDESVVLKDYVYASGTKTGTLDTSSLDVPSDLTQQFDDIYTKLNELKSRLSIADIIQALTQYTAVKVSDLASISIDTQDIKDALDEYHAVTEEYVSACLGEDI